MTVTKIGEMNGWTPVLFKIQLVVTPIIMTSILGMGTWLVSSVNELRRYQAVMTERVQSFAAVKYSAASARADHLQLKVDILEEVGKRYPPTYLLKQVDTIDERLKRIEDKMNGAAL